ncbi:MAG: hypothetical protein JNL11_18755 [Bdellovibrionaceae bacterium]|nr:hypothetical protein [Pseudobdellovibrionaceae bacterium]
MADAITELPPVAKSFHTFCKKCDVDRYHKVLAHKTATSAKVECEVCHSKSTFTLPKAKKATTARTPRSPSANQRKSNHQSEYQELLSSLSSMEEKPYSLKAKFEIANKINHPKFGVGVVRSVQPDKIEVVFSDEVKLLIHNRP